MGCPRLPSLDGHRLLASCAVHRKLQGPIGDPEVDRSDQRERPDRHRHQEEIAAIAGGRIPDRELMYQICISPRACSPCCRVLPRPQQPPEAQLSGTTRHQSTRVGQYRFGLRIKRLDVRVIPSAPDVSTSMSAETAKMPSREPRVNRRVGSTRSRRTPRSCTAGRTDRRRTAPGRLPLEGSHRLAERECSQPPHRSRR